MIRPGICCSVGFVNLSIVFSTLVFGQVFVTTKCCCREEHRGIDCMHLLCGPNFVFLFPLFVEINSCTIVGSQWNILVTTRELVSAPVGCRSCTLACCVVRGWNLLARTWPSNNHPPGPCPGSVKNLAYSSRVLAAIRDCQSRWES